MANLSLCEITQSQLNSTPVKDGQIICALDTGNFYRDTATSRVHLGHEFEPVEALPLAPIANKIYLLRPDKLYIYNEGWVLLNTKSYKIKVTASAANGAVKLSVDGSSDDVGTKLSGSGLVSVTSDSNGNITVATTAEKNQNAFANIKVGSSTVEADSATDTVEFVAGSNVSITPDATNDKITISAIVPTKVSQLTNDSGYKTTDNNTTYSISKSGSTITLTGSDGSTSTVSDANTTYSAATTSAAGLMSVDDKKKLDGVASGAEVNQNAFSSVVVGDTTVAADSKTDTLTLVAGANVMLTPDATNDKITIASKDTVYTHPSYSTKSAGLYKVTVDGTGHVSVATAVTKSDITALGIPAQDTTYNTATASANGLMSFSDKSKLDGIAAGANKTTVDSALSSTSTNPVQNKVVNTAISNLNSLVGDTAVATQITNAVSVATSRTWTVSVPDSGWTRGSLTFMGIECTYKNVVSISEMTSDVSIDLVKYNSGDVKAAKSYICLNTGNGTITFWAKSALATFSVKLMEVR